MVRVRPSRAVTRSRSCSAALREKVSARIASGGTPSSMRSTTASTSVVVLPVPGPASTSSGPSRVLDHGPLLRVEHRHRDGGVGADEAVGAHVSHPITRVRHRLDGTTGRTGSTPARRRRRAQPRLTGG